MIHLWTQVYRRFIFGLSALAGVYWNGITCEIQNRKAVVAECNSLWIRRPELYYHIELG